MATLTHWLVSILADIAPGPETLELIDQTALSNFIWILLAFALVLVVAAVVTATLLIRRAKKKQSKSDAGANRPPSSSR